MNLPFSVNGLFNRFYDPFGARSSEVWIRFMEKLDEYAPGKNIREKVSAYLYQCGIKEETLEKIRKILLDDAK